MAKKQYLTPRSYHGSTACPLELKDAQLKKLFDDICICKGNKGKTTPIVHHRNAKDVLWNGRCLWLYITEEVLGGEYSEFEKHIIKNYATFGTLKRMPSEMYGYELTEIGICCAVSTRSDLTLQTFLEGYIKYCIKKSWAKYVEVFKFHQDLILKFTSVSVQPTFSQPLESMSIYDFASDDRITFRGREGDKKVLKSFLNDDAKFLWFQISGVAGQGKSRLAWELVLEIQDEWEAGFLSTKDITSFGNHWATWQPMKPYLFVIDNVIGKQQHIKKFFHTLAKRDDFEKPVRILFVERHPWNTSEKLNSKAAEMEIRQYSDWFLKLLTDEDSEIKDFSKTVFPEKDLPLKGLGNNDLKKIIFEVSGFNKDPKFLDPFNIDTLLDHFNPTGTPLYTCFIASAWKESFLDKSVNEAINNVLDLIMERESSRRWSTFFKTKPPSVGENSIALKLSVIATITQGLNVKDLFETNIYEKIGSDEKLRSLVFNDGQIKSGARSPGNFIPPMTPFLLGDWFVLAAFEESLNIGPILDIAWQLNPNETLGFLLRISKNFPDLKIRLKILEYSPKSENAKTVYYSNINTIAKDIIKSGYALSDKIIKILKISASDYFNANAMLDLGYLYDYGLGGINQNKQLARNYYEMAAVNGSSKGFFNLAVIEQDKSDVINAIKLYQQAEALGLIRAITNQAVLLQNLNADLAEELYLKAHGLGDVLATTNLGIIYTHHKEGEKAQKKGFDYFLEAAEMGEPNAMKYLILCFNQGIGVLPDPEKALYWTSKYSNALIASDVFNT